MQIEVGQKYDFTKIGKYGCGDQDKYWCKSWLPFSRSVTTGRRGGDGCSLPAAHQNDRWANPNISGNSWGDGTNDLRAFRNFPPKGERRSAPPFWDRLDCTHCTYHEPPPMNHFGISGPRRGLTQISKLVKMTATTGNAVQKQSAVAQQQHCE